VRVLAFRSRTARSTTLPYQRTCHRAAAGPHSPINIVSKTSAASSTTRALAPSRLDFDFALHIAPGRFTFYQAIVQASAYTTTFSAFSGAVTLNGSASPAINLTSEIKFTIESAVDGTLVCTGAFNVVNNVSSLAVDDTAFSPLYQTYAGNGNIRYEWAATGTLAVDAPDPSAGDFNFDGVVDGTDFLLWQRNPSVGSLDDWKANFGLVVTSQGSAARVPEPAAEFLLAAAFAASSTLRMVTRSVKRERVHGTRLEARSEWSGTLFAGLPPHWGIASNAAGRGVVSLAGAASLQSSR
jgi:hypothetical protein